MIIFFLKTFLTWQWESDFYFFFPHSWIKGLKFVWTFMMLLSERQTALVSLTNCPTENNLLLQSIRVTTAHSVLRLLSKNKASSKSHSQDGEEIQMEGEWCEELERRLQRPGRKTCHKTNPQCHSTLHQLFINIKNF